MTQVQKKIKMKSAIIKEVMTNNLITLHPKNKISRAKEIFSSHKIHHIPVVINDKVVGIISLGDVLAKENKTHDHMLQVGEINNISMMTVDEIMTSRPITINSEDKLIDALEIMHVKRINCLPVVSEEKLCGILTSYDIIAYLLKSLTK